jgi:hypothetical protein
VFKKQRQVDVGSSHALHGRAQREPSKRDKLPPSRWGDLSMIDFQFMHELNVLEALTDGATAVSVGENVRPRDSTRFDL